MSDLGFFCRNNTQEFLKPYLRHVLKLILLEWSFHALLGKLQLFLFSNVKKWLTYQLIHFDCWLGSVSGWDDVDFTNAMPFILKLPAHFVQLLVYTAPMYFKEKYALIFGQKICTQSHQSLDILWQWCLALIFIILWFWHSLLLNDIQFYDSKNDWEILKINVQEGNYSLLEINGIIIKLFNISWEGEFAIILGDQEFSENVVCDLWLCLTQVVSSLIKSQIFPKLSSIPLIEAKRYTL